MKAGNNRKKTHLHYFVQYAKLVKGYFHYSENECKLKCCWQWAMQTTVNKQSVTFEILKPWCYTKKIRSKMLQTWMSTRDSKKDSGGKVFCYHFLSLSFKLQTLTQPHAFLTHALTRSCASLKEKKSHKPVSDHSHPVKKSAFFYHHSKLLVHHAVSMPDWDLQNPTNSVAFFPLFFCVLANGKSYEHSTEFRTKGKASSRAYAILKNKK